jgi:hypothetical protein
MAYISLRIYFNPIFLFFCCFVCFYFGCTEFDRLSNEIDYFISLIPADPVYPV